MICPNCGAEVLGGSKCPECGAQFDVSDSIVEVEPVEVMKPPFYQRSWFIVLALIIFWPLGVFLMWKYSRCSVVIKIIVTLIFVFAAFGTVRSNYFG